ncbi:LacI family DNA-binding transcriptional regulator [Streptomyces cyaneofuscatus]|uniref:LacI family transcriptional regulator n=1 Tax=Streptomyces arboris TaxID=2600619 RepID=A0A5N5EW33_9ACTN|nr:MULTISPECIES: LacI family DNA-binding transcriptional regulator [Streptomyces]KAB2590174.1 LacI family transcriptional regulator [Streptomyces arboris]MDX3373075.1 LacI family DNA-binding transcriptional regulator [Streptomyces sp. ME02-6991-2A]
MSETPVRRSGRVTINDVAARAGVSRGAVSLAFNNRPGVSEATRERIMEAVTELGWVPSQTAIKLSGSATGAADTVGLVIARPARQLGLEPFYMEFISGAESVLEEHRCSLLLHLVRDVTQEIAVHREWWQSRRIAGSILVDIQQNDPRVTELAAIGLPAVAVGHPSLTGGFTSVWTDDEAAVHEAVRYLAALGHRRIARVGGHPSLGHTIIRTAALNSIVAELGLEPARSVTTDYSGEQGARATRSLLASPHRPTAIVYDNDIMAVAGLSVAAEMGLDVPRDVSLIAWDDSQLCQLTHPTLSAMSHDVFGFGADVTRRLFDVVHRRDLSSGPAAPPVLLPRGSSAPPRQPTD